MRALLVIIAVGGVATATEPVIIAKPGAFPTLINPNSIHSVDEVKGRKDDLKYSDPVLCWIRLYSEGGAIPMRFFQS